MARKNIHTAALTDFDKVSGAVAFSQACVESGIKPILGSKIFISDDNGYVTVIARNKAGWHELAKLSSLSHNTDHLVSRPSVSFAELSTLRNVIVMAGEPESILATAVVAKNISYSSKTNFFLHSDSEDRVRALLRKYKLVFGDKFFVAIQRMNVATCPVDTIVADMLRYAATMLNIKCVAVPNSFYLNKSDKPDQNLLLCSLYKFHWNDLATVVNTEEYANLNRFVNDDNCHLPTVEEMESVYTEEELKNSLLVGDMCESYSILDNPKLPVFQCPNGITETQYLRQLCREGWQGLSSKLDLSKTSEYVARIEQELAVFTEAKLEGYFLIVQDYVQWVKKQNILVGCGRGSVGGSLVAYLLGITTIDPIQYGLFFERFYNKGRNSPGKVSLPDIDVDFPVFFRESVIEYIRDKYNRDNVTQVCTFSSLQGRGAIKEVLRVHRVCNQDTMNYISSRLPNKAEIEDKMQESKEVSIINWVLDNDPKAIEEWCKKDDTGKLVGSMAEYFAQAIRIEGTYKSYGKHASAVVIGASTIADICPMINDKQSGKLIAGIEYEHLELMGLPKFDLLGLSTLDKLMNANSLLKSGRCLSNVDFSENNESEDQ